MLCLPNKWVTMGTMTEDWQRLADAVVARRAQLRLSQEDVRAAGGPSDVVLSRIEQCREPHPRGNTIQKLDVGLQWEPGSAAAVLAGGEPTPVGQPAALNQVSTDALIDEVVALVTELQRRAATDDPRKIVPGSADDVFPPWSNGDDNRMAWRS